VRDPLRIFRVTDDKPGHQTQSSGLVAALSRQTKVVVTDVPALPSAAALSAWLTGRLPRAMATSETRSDDNAKDRLVVCCGHATHLTALAARRAWGGHLLALMRPSLPVWLFDLVVVPRHDELPEGGRIVLTEGVLNPLTADGAHNPDAGIILIGGPSRHHDWDKTGMLQQVETIAKDQPDVHWTLTTSRRTPPTTAAALSALELPNLEVMPLMRTGPGWVGRQLAASGSAWISEDSVSMIYEGLTAGVRVGLLTVPLRDGGGGRAARGLDALLRAERVVRLLPDGSVPTVQQHPPLAEADRIARTVLGRWFPERLTMDAA